MPSTVVRHWVGILVTARPLSLLLLLYVCLRAAFVGGGVFVPDVFETALLLAVCAAASFLFNDAHDVEADTLVHRSRPIPQGECSARSAVGVGLALLIAAASAAAYIGGPGLMMAIASVGVCGVAYSPIAQRLGIAKGALACALCLWPIALVTRAAGAHVPLLWYVGAACFLFGRELLMDVRDMFADAGAGRQTLPHVLGSRTATTIGWILVAAGVAVLPRAGQVVRPCDLMLYGSLLVGGVLWKFDTDISTGALRLTMIAAVEYIAGR
jgi:4-hydroxybenzoate polyprenyltransferase